METTELVTFKVEDELFSLEKSKISQDSFLGALITTQLETKKDENGTYLLEISKEEFLPVFNYLQKGILPSVDQLHHFDYFGINLTHSYELASVIEEDMRAQMYISENPQYKENYYGLRKITSEFWKAFKVDRSLTLHDDNLLFISRSFQKDSWDNISLRLAELRELTSIKGVFVAGGSIFSILMGLPIKDIDVFLCVISEEEAREAILKIRDIIRTKATEREIAGAIEIIKKTIDDPEVDDLIRKLFENNIDDIESLKELLISKGIDRQLMYEQTQRIYSHLIRHCHFSSTCTRTANAITFKNSQSEIQVILRLYQTPSEVIHGFDVDSCCLGFDGENIWMTHRAHFALKNGYNTVNFGRLSPSYEMRLVKYGTRGMAVRIPNFSRNKIDYDKLKTYFEENRPKQGKLMCQNYCHLNKLKGLDTLIYLEHHCEVLNYKPRSMNVIDKLNHEKSDYDNAYPFVDAGRHLGGNEIREILDYLKRSRNEHLEFSNKYMPYIKEIETLIDEEFPDDEYEDKNENEDEDENDGEDQPILPVLQLALPNEGVIPGLIAFDHNMMRDYNIENRFNIESDKEDIPKDAKVLATVYLYTNCVPLCTKIWFIKGTINDLEIILDIPEIIHKCLECVRPWNFPASVVFKITQPGEQMTNTFHQIVLQDNQTWYNGQFYSI